MARLLLIALALLALTAAPTQAATVGLTEIHVEDDDESYDREDDSYSYSVLRFKAAPGERNRLTIRRVKGGILFRDAGARIRPQGGCRRAGRRAAVCRRGVDLRRVAIRLRGHADRLTVSSRIYAYIDAEGGPGADRLTAGGGRVGFSGGAGDDRVTGGPGSDYLAGDGGRDRLMGGNGRDHLEGGRGRDRLLGGRGNDALLPADGAGDSVDGGSGRDAANYHGSKAGVTLTPRGGGAGSERDAFTAIENLGGTEHDDVLTGDDAANRIWGRAGDDRIDARGGNDTVDVYANSPKEGSVDATCGEGTDKIETYVGNDRVLIRRDCERITYSSAGTGFDPRPTPPAGRTVQLSLPCAGTGDAAASRAITVRSPGAGRAWFETGPFDVEMGTGVLPVGPAGENCATAVELTDAGVALVQERAEIPVVVRIGDRFISPFAVVLRAT